jgi:hypothetical protein
MASPSYTFSEFIDRLLVRLYERDREADNPARFIDLLELSKEFKEIPPERWVVDAANELRTMGLAAVEINSMGVQALLTGRGRLYVERGQGKTRDFLSQPEKYYNKVTNVHVHGNQNQIAVGPATQTLTVERDTSLASRIVGEMKEALHKDQIAQAEKDKAISYLELVEKEMKAPEPNQNILAAILEPLSKIASIAGNVATLIQIING